MARTIFRYCAVMLVAILVAASVRTGMFFDLDIYLIGTGFGVLLLSMAGGWKYGKRRREAAVPRVAPASLQFDRGLPVILGCIGGILLIYGFHGIRGPLSLEGTMKEIVLWGCYGSFAAAAWSVCRTADGLKVMRMGWHLTGAALCGSALLAVYGLLELPHGIHHTADAAISATGARLGGLLQYPNTFGAVMAAFLLERLFALPSVPWTRAGALRTAAALLPLLPYTAALLLTESRGAWLAAALACAAGFAKERHALAPLLVAAAAPLASAAMLYRQLAAAQLAPAVLPGLLWLAGLWAGGVLAGLLLCRWRHSGVPRRRYAPGALVAAALLAAAAAMLILLQLQDRALGGAATLSARRLMYSDAWQLAQSSLWLGRGGETWRQSYLAIQSQPYVGAEVHSGYIDILLDTGFIGLLLVLILLIFVLTKLMQANPRALPPAIVLIVHAAVDFDWSFGLVWLLLLWIAAIGLAEAFSGNVPQHGYTATKRRWQLNLSAPLQAVVREGNRANPALLRLLSLTAVLTLLGWTVLAACLGLSEVNNRAAPSATGGQQIALLRSSLRWNPANTSAALDLSDRLPPSQRIPLLKRAMAYAPEHPGLSWKLAEDYFLRGESKEAAAWYNASLHLDRFNTVKQTRAVLRMASLADWHHAAGEQAESMQSARAALAILQRYRSLAGGLHDMPHLRNDRDFNLTVLADRQLKRLENRLRLGTPERLDNSRQPSVESWIQGLAENSRAALPAESIPEGGG